MASVAYCPLVLAGGRWRCPECGWSVRETIGPACPRRRCPVLSGPLPSPRPSTLNPQPSTPPDLLTPYPAAALRPEAVARALLAECQGCDHWGDCQVPCRIYTRGCDAREDFRRRLSGSWVCREWPWPLPEAPPAA